MSFLEKNIPETAEAFNRMRDSILKDGALDSRTKELIAVASSVLMRCEHCTELHSKKALSYGATSEQIAEAISVAMLIAAGSQMGWTDIYDRVLDTNEEDKTTGTGWG